MKIKALAATLSIISLMMAFAITPFDAMAASSANSRKESANDSDDQYSDDATTTKSKRSLLAYPVELMVGGAINTGVTEIMKSKIHELRPNGENYESMPSRHTSWMFTATTLLSIELSHRTPWVAVVSYAAGSAMGVERVMSRNHYPGDVFAGAGIGTTSGVLGYVLTNLAFGRPHNYPKISNIYFDYTPYLSIETGALFHMDDKFRGKRIGTGIMTSVYGVVPIGKKWGVSGRLLVSSSPVSTTAGNNFIAPLNRVGILGGVNVEVAPCDWPLSLGASAEAGYVRTLNSSKLDLSKNSPMFRGSVSIALPVTTMLTIALHGGYELSHQRIGGTSKALQSITLDLSTRAYF